MSLQLIKVAHASLLLMVIFLVTANIEGEELLVTEINQDDYASSRKENPYLEELAFGLK